MTRRTRHRAARPRRPTDHLLEARYPFRPREILSADEVAHIRMPLRIDIGGPRDGPSSNSTPGRRGGKNTHNMR